MDKKKTTIIIITILILTIIIYTLSLLMQSTPPMGTHPIQTYEYLCTELESKTYECQCYREYINSPIETDTINISDCCENPELETDLKEILNCS